MDAAAPKKVVMVIAPRNFRDEELAVPKQLLAAAGFQVTVACTQKQVCIGMLGARVQPDITVAEVKLSEYAGIIFVGGAGAQAYFEDHAVRGLARSAVEAGLVVGAICLAPGILAREGLLKGKTATVWEGAANMLTQGGARLAKQDVAVDGKLVTGNGPEAARKFGEQFLKML